MASDHRLLVMSCSQRKRQTPGLLPAVERYDGPAFKVLRRFLRERPEVAEHLEVFILSAAYGLIPAKHPVRNYDQVMTPQRAVELHKDVLATFTAVVGDGTWTDICLALSRRYMAALEGWDSLIPVGVSTTMADGSQGIRLSRLKRWLWTDLRDIADEQSDIQVVGRARIRGVELTMTPDQVLEVARKALADKHTVANRYYSWYVPVDGQRIAPKWLVSQVTGLPVSDFHSQEARRVLQQLSVEVRLDGRRRYNER